MLNRSSKIWLIAKRELRDQLRDWRMLTPMLILALGFPFFMNEVSYRTINFINQFGGPPIIVDRLVPASIFIIGFFPVTVALVIALEAFVGEKERGTIEPLLSSPLNSKDLYLGKLLAGASTPILASYLSITVYLVLVSRQQLQMPPIGIIAQLFALTTAHGILMISAAIIVSIQSTSIKSANLMASFIVVPVAILMQSEAGMLFWEGDDARTLWFIVIGIFVLSTLLIRLGMAHFHREYLLGREIDELNIRQLSKSFWQAFKGKAVSVRNWYSITVRESLQRLRTPLLVTTVLAIAAFAVGYQWTITNVPSMLERASSQNVTTFTELLKKSPDLQTLGRDISVTYLFRHNVRTMVIILILGIVSFSVLGMFIYLINAALIGGVLGVFQIIGLSPLNLFLYGILPHGIFELPALLLASATVLRLGIMLVTPQLGKSMGDIFIELLADWAKIFIGLVVPLLAVAAMVEVYVTPTLLLSILK